MDNKHINDAIDRLLKQVLPLLDEEEQKKLKNLVLDFYFEIKTPE